MPFVRFVCGTIDNYWLSEVVLLFLELEIVWSEGRGVLYVSFYA